MLRVFRPYFHHKLSNSDADVLLALHIQQMVFRSKGSDFFNLGVLLLSHFNHFADLGDERALQGTNG